MHRSRFPKSQSVSRHLIRRGEKNRGSEENPFKRYVGVLGSLEIEDEVSTWLGELRDDKDQNNENQFDEDTV